MTTGVARDDYRLAIGRKRGHLTHLSDMSAATHRNATGNPLDDRTRIHWGYLFSQGQFFSIFFLGLAGPPRQRLYQFKIRRKFSNRLGCEVGKTVWKSTLYRLLPNISILRCS
jgi:hypothetical protein